MSELLEIPWRRLAPAQLEAMAEAFILREGTDYGLTELDHAVKVKRLLDLIQQGDVLITFDPATESFNIVKRKR
jgi:uncharacterized protein YheU (UPF0270 family)